MDTAPRSDRVKVRRYAEELADLHGRLSFRRLPEQLDGEPLWLRRRDASPLTTVAALEQQIPNRYLLGIYGFRLAQYLRLDWVCADTVYLHGLIAEPRHHTHPLDVHVVTLDQRSGCIVGYVCLAHGDQTATTTFGEQTRALFPFEVAHQVRVEEKLPDLSGVSCASAREVKRFVRDVTLRDKELRSRVPWESLTGLGAVLMSIDPRIELLVGDLQESVALQHLLSVGMRTRLILNTQPMLNAGDIMRPMYVKRSAVRPFVADVPALERMKTMIEAVDQALTSGEPFRLGSARAA